MREAKALFMYVCGNFWDAVNLDSDLDEDCIVAVVRLQETFLENYICVFLGCLCAAPLPNHLQTCLCGVQRLSKWSEVLGLSSSKIIRQTKENVYFS